MGVCNRKCGIISLMSIGTILALVGLLISLLWATLYQTILTKELVLTKTSQSFNLWKETPIPMYFSVYLFNWTNADEVIESKWAVKPKLEQCGPYVFSEHHVRVNLTWNNNNTVSFQQKRIWHFLPEFSNGTLSDNITNINPIVSVVGNKAKDLNIIFKILINRALKWGEKALFQTRTVDELIFKGYEDKILSILANLTIPGFSIPFTKFGWFYGRNNSETYDGNFTMFTGTNDIELLGIMDLWNGEPYTKDYSGNCAYVNGTSGELWPPVDKYDRITIFSSDVCSSLYLDYRPEEIVINGLKGKKFVGTDYTFDNGTKYEEQACFKGVRVIPSGARDISKCKFNAPAFLSYPHFYLGDPTYLTKVDGLRPNKTEHEMYMTLEPTTGIPLDVKAQLQLNLFVQVISGMSIFDNIKPTYMPMLWFKQTALLTEDYSKMVRVLLNMNSVGLYVGWTGFSIGVLLVLIGSIMLFRKNRPPQEIQHLLDNEEQ